MKKAVVLTILMLMTSAGFAAEKKRPSWSQDLPERNKNSVPQIEIDKSSLLKPNNLSRDFAKDNRLYSQPLAQPINQISDNTAKSPPATQKQTPLITIHSKPMANPDSFNYQWQITRLVQVSAPAFWLAEYPSVQVEISIDPKGRVNQVKGIGNQPIPEGLLLKIKRTIKQWRFSAPEDHGIQNTISRAFKIQLKSDHS